MTYQICHGVGLDLHFEDFSNPQDLTNRLTELGVRGDIPIPLIGNSEVRSQEWVKTDYDPEWGDMKMVEWYWTAG